MNVAKLLKVKNRLAGKIEDLKSKIIQYNVTKGGTTNPYNAAGLYVEMVGLTERLALVKSAVAVSNAGVKSFTEVMIKDAPCFSIFMMAELKGIVSMLKTLPVKSGKELESIGFRSDPVEVEYKSSIVREMADNLIGMVEKEIERLQDNLDGHNACTDVPFIDLVLGE